ncbi:MAG TPA: DUF3576 domain-containing protein [Caulobacterales bacterium]|nr:DUF3576 domain-containing protein [Caulobacterales bacterium]
MNQRGRTLLKAAICVAAAGALTACSTFKPDTDRQPGQSRDSDVQSSGGGIGIPLLGGGGGSHRSSDQPTIGVNSFLWRASLDTLAFMPLTSVDPFGGVIITDWHSDAATPNERFKATVYILDTRLRADALNVSIFRQTLVNGQWQDAAVNPDTESQIENAILRRARELRLSTVQGH